MKRLSRREGSPVSLRLADEAGFTLVELLVAMVVSIIVLGGGVYGLARAFTQTTEVSARTASVSQAEVGLQRLTNDLRFATPCPTYNGVNTLGAGGKQVSGVLVSTGPTLQTCDPVAGPHASQPPALALVTWTCTVGASSESCTRTLGAILCPTATGTAAATGPCTTGAPSLSASISGSTVITGVTSLTLSGLVSGTNQTSLLPSTSSPCLVATGYWTYGLTTGATCPLSWVGVQAQVTNLVDPGSPSDAANAIVAGKTSGIQIQTGVALRNYGA